MQELNFDGSTNLHITQLDEYTHASIGTYPEETNSLKQITGMLFYIQQLLKQISDALIQTQQRQMLQADDECRNSWMLVVMVIDRLLLLLFTLLTIIVYCIYSSVIEPSDLCLYTCRSTTGNTGLRMKNALAPSDVMMLYIEVFEQERRNSSALAMELRLSCSNRSISSYDN